MSMTKRWILMTGVALLITGAAYASGQIRKSQQAQSDQQAALMLAKLASSQKITNGLVTKDFEEIRRGATELSRICSATEWASHKDQIYAHHRTELQKQAQKLAKMAEEKNLDGATFTYMHSLTTCISCHEYCRDVLRIVDHSRNDQRVIPIPISKLETGASNKRPVRR